MTTQFISIGNCRCEVLTEGTLFLGLGKAWIGDTLVRSGRLPLRPYSQTFTGLELSALTLRDIVTHDDEVRICLTATFQPLEVKLMRDHSFDPIHEKRDWDAPSVAGVGDLTIVLRPAAYSVNGVAFQGFSYQYRYTSADVPLFYLLDKASWELDGDVAGATVYSQSSCSDPVATFTEETFWTTEGELFFLDQASVHNRVMTHNLPRWASHQAFDYQYKGGNTLLGIFDHVDLIRSLLVREPGKAELKTFDKHIFDEARDYETSAKAIVLNTQAKSETDQQNLWTWIFDDLHSRARAEFGLREQPPIATGAQHYWENRVIDTYYKDVVPAFHAIGIRAIFTENFKKCDAAGPMGGADHRLPNGNMCCSQEYEISERSGGMGKFVDYIQHCQRLGMANYMWTNTYVSLAADLNSDHRCEAGSWYAAMEDTRTKYAGAYTSVSSNLNFKNPDARRYYIDAHKKIAQESGLEGYYIDSFYNLFFMPVDYATGHPRTMWREALEVMKELQDAGVGFYIESFGPFGQPGHGHPASYSPDKIFICYYVGLGNGYVTVPVPGVVTGYNFSHDPAFLFYQFAHKTPYAPPLFIDGKRVDEVYGDLHRRVIADYHTYLPLMGRRYLQPDGLAVLWHNALGDQATLWNFADRRATLPGTVIDLTANVVLPIAEVYDLQALHIYAISGCPLPTRVGE